MVHIYSIVIHYNFYKFNNKFKYKKLSEKIHRVLTVNFYDTIFVVFLKIKEKFGTGLLRPEVILTIIVTI